MSLLLHPLNQLRVKYSISCVSNNSEGACFLHLLGVQAGNRTHAVEGGDLRTALHDDRDGQLLWYTRRVTHSVRFMI